ncbi:Peptidase S9, prolyl oligopeptidase, catalytic domain-containing protein [Rozella allomycis CSF55]|uniref:Prolyl endopeptidase n=1 Tax=Rozella allomycis (strain CSF55) TaxID=988480 RepID=A0A075AMJ0_ROZAC|nr:Peptidase S9, prolyl oligopeptidase, catalytic domain-containing protein [Rozella allomycis CSF55]|eukprot:EPZ30823.1 Peptidase S9, prolyl oligopeptidase, catalytic domain-containing protein [Rozella allomycis CSF55]
MRLLRRLDKFFKKQPDVCKFSLDYLDKIDTPLKENFQKEKFDSSRLLKDKYTEKLIFSPKHNYIGMIATDKNEKKCLCVYNFNAQQSYEIQNVYNAVWSGLDEYLVYTKQKEGLIQPYQVYLHKVGSNEKDLLIFETKDDCFVVDVSITKNNKFILIHKNTRNSNEICLVDANSPWETPVKLNLSERGEYYIESYKKGDFQVSRTDFNRWETIYAENPVDDAELFNLQEGHLMLTVKINAYPRLVHVNMETLEKIIVQTPDVPSKITSGVNIDHEASSYNFTWESPICPPVEMNYNFITKEVSNLNDVKEIINAKIETKSVFNGDVEIPVTIIKPLEKSLKGALLNAYGCYGVPLNADFKIQNAHLLQNGMSIALAHIRGGGDKGRSWHQSAVTKNKINSAVSLDLIKENKICNENTLCGIGVSAGGFTFGALHNLHPFLFRCLILRCPFLDPHAMLMDEKHSLSTLDYSEFGDPTRNIKDKENLKELSPLLNIPIVCRGFKPNAQKDINLLVTASLNDKRVDFKCAEEWVLKKRASLKSLSKSSKVETFVHWLWKENDSHADMSSISNKALENTFLLDKLNY